MNPSGLLDFYRANIRSILTYTCPAWYTMLTKLNQQQLIKIERSALRIINYDLSYEKCTKKLKLPPLHVFIEDLIKGQFQGIIGSTLHPLHNRIIYNDCRTSSRRPRVFKNIVYRTATRRKAFLPHSCAKYQYTGI